MADVDAFTRLALERERTQFTFYGFRTMDGQEGGPYFKLAHSLSEALADLEANPGVADEGGYLVRDAFLEKTEGEVVIHVELISMEEIANGALDERG